MSSPTATIDNNNITQKQLIVQTIKIYGLDDFACGCFGGVAKVLAGHPFDTVKGRVQAGTYGATCTPLQALRATIQNEGALALYKGLVPPCVAVGFVSGTLFFVNGRVRNFVQPDKNVPLTYSQMLFAASCGGAAVGCVVTPFEVLKLNRQIASSSTANNGTTNSKNTTTIKGIVQHSGFGVRGLYCGFASTLIRESGTFGFFFPINEYLRSNVKTWYFAPTTTTDGKESQQQQQQLPIYLRVCCAGLSGMICWFPFYPIDQIKTRIQTQSFSSSTSNNSKKMLSMSEAFKQLYFNEGGIRRLYRGLSPCLIRAFPAYSAQYTTYEAALKFVHSHE